MDWFDAASFWAGLGLGLVSGIALVCFTLAWCWAGRPCNVNPPAPANIRPRVAPKAPPPAPAKRHHLTVEPHRPLRGPDLGPELRR